MRGLYIFILLSLFTWGSVSAQWLEKDSLWVEDVISNGGEYRLNPETMEAIRNGTLLNSEMFKSAPVMAPGRLPISKEFPEVGVQDSLFHGLNILHLPPSVVLLYQNEPDSILIINSAVLKEKDNILVTGFFRIPHTSVEITAPNADLLLPDIELINGEWQGNLRARTFSVFSAEDGLEEIFEPTERQKAKNRRDANAWKTYNMQEMDD